MDIEELVERYFAAWNRHDVAGLLAVMHKGVAYYDAFWRETCVGRDLEQYLIDSFEIEPYFYCQIGDLVTVESGVVFRYSAHIGNGTDIGEVLFYGAEVLTIRDDKILTVSDFYCSSDKKELDEIARLSLRRHGQSMYASEGLGAKKSSIIRSEIARMIDNDTLRLYPELTVAELADQIGCTVDQFLHVISKEIKLNVGSNDDQENVRGLTELAQGKSVGLDSSD